MTIEPSNELPHNIEAEQALLGCLLIHNHAFERIDTLGAEHFFDPLHGRIFEEISACVAAARLASPVTLKTVFECDAPITDELSVPQYLGRLAANAASTAHAADYARTLIDLAKRRQLVEIGQWIVREAYEAPLQASAEQQVEAAEGALYQIAESGRRSTPEATFAAAASEVVNTANEAYRSKGTTRGLSTGLSDLDAKLGGLQPSDLIVLAGRPSMGKTALATNIAWNVARHGRVSPDCEPITAPVHFFSLEMSAEQLATRILSAEIEVPSEKLRRGAVEERHVRDLIAAEHQLRDVPLIIDQTGGISIAQLAARARRTKRRCGTALIVIDYLQLMTGSHRRGGNRVEEVTEITTGLKALAKELQVPIIALSQLSRQVEGRTEKRPQLADLRESGSIEQDADVVLFVYREEYYVERAEPDAADGAKHAEWQSAMQRCAGKAEVILGKQRHGPTGVVPLSFDGRLTRFSNLAREAGCHG
jgi:replicative DNA helicase